jgi:4-amino-4-deoxy-L-arabinose transferase-like glycosyltransferase
MIAVAVSVAVLVIAATWIGQPELRVRAASSDALRYLSGFWDVERNDTGSFRWSQTDATIRLFGLEQQAPLLWQARMSATRKAGLPLVQLTVAGTEAPLQFPVQREWRRYMALLPAPARGTEGRTLELHSLAQPRQEDARDLGVALDWFAAAQQPLGSLDRLPDAGRLIFLALLGLLSYTGARQAGCAIGMALPLVVSAAVGLCAGIAIAPSLVAYWLPNLWLALLAGWLVLLVPWILPKLRARQSNAMAAFALLAIGAGIGLLPIQQWWSSSAGWALLGGGCVLLAAALPAWPPWEPTPLSRRAVAAMLSAITVLALALRLYHLDALPLGMWRDEARHGLLALRILNDTNFRPVYVPEVADIPALLFYLAAIPIGLFGAHPWSIRLAPALAGALTPPALYYMARPLFGTRVGLVAAALLAISTWHISLSRLAFAATLGPPLTLLALGLVWRALQPEPSGKRLLEAALAGGATGLAIYAYHPSRLTPLVVAIAIAIRLGRDPRAWRAAAPRLAALALAAALVAWPLIQYGLTQSAGFSQRIAQTSIFNRDSLAGRAPAARVEENVRLNLGIWNERGDRIGRHNLPDAPMLDPLTGAAFVIGAGLILARLRDRRALMLVLWMGLALTPGIFSIEAPHAVRTVEVIAPTMLLASIGACGLANWGACQAWHNNGRQLVRVLGLGLLMVALALNLTRYFVTWPAAPKAYEEFFVAETHLGEVVQRLAGEAGQQASNYRIFVPRSAAKSDVLRYLTTGIELGTFEDERQATPAGKRSLLIVEGDQEAAGKLIGRDMELLGAGPISPLTGRPEFAIYGRGAEARQAVARALTP